MFLLLNQVYTLAPNTVTNLDSFFKRQGFANAGFGKPNPQLSAKRKVGTSRSAAKFPFLF